jgi:hypothetical protein
MALPLFLALGHTRERRKLFPQLFHFCDACGHKRNAAPSSDAPHSSSASSLSEAPPDGQARGCSCAITHVRPAHAVTCGACPAAPACPRRRATAGGVLVGASCGTSYGPITPLAAQAFPSPADGPPLPSSCADPPHHSTTDTPVAMVNCACRSALETLPSRPPDPLPAADAPPQGSLMPPTRRNEYRPPPFGLSGSWVGAHWLPSDPSAVPVAPQLPQSPWRSCSRFSASRRTFATCP